MISPDAPDFFRVPGIKVRTPRGEVGNSVRFRQELPDNAAAPDRDDLATMSVKWWWHHAGLKKTRGDFFVDHDRSGAPEPAA